MNKLEFGDIVLIKFPFSNGLNFKRRPALIIKDTYDGDVIVCRVTSHIYNTKNDIFMNNWKETGLRLPSVIRVHKIATLQKDMIEMQIGNIDQSLKNRIKTIIANLPE